jgi:hypothetical protein
MIEMVRTGIGHSGMNSVRHQVLLTYNTLSIDLDKINVSNVDLKCVPAIVI